MKRPVFEHRERNVRRRIVTGDDRLIRKVEAHVSRHIGPADRHFHAVVSDPVHVDVLWVPPATEGGFHTLVTCGMSERRMGNLSCDCGHAELLLRLPASWPLDRAARLDERHVWPVRELALLARFPHAHDTMLWGGHTVANGGDSTGRPAPLGPGTRLCGWVLDDPLWAAREFRWLTVDPKRKVRFFSVIPVYAEELNLAYERGTPVLLEHLDLTGVGDVVDPLRPNLLAWPS